MKKNKSEGGKIIVNRNIHDYGLGSWLGGMASGAAGGASMGPVGAVIGAVTGGIKASLGDQAQESMLREQRKATAGA